MGRATERTLEKIASTKAPWLKPLQKQQRQSAAGGKGQEAGEQNAAVLGLVRS